MSAEKRTERKKTLVSVLLLAATVLGIAACTGNGSERLPSDTGRESTGVTSLEDTSDSSTEESTGAITSSKEEIPVLDKNKHYEILFVGNSYTYFNSMPAKIFAPIAKAAGYDVTVRTITEGGWYLIDSANASDKVGKKVEAMLNVKKFDYVVLQEQSTCPALLPGKFYDGVRQLVDKIRANGAVPVLYGTWGRKTGSGDLTANGWTNESMTWMISAAYEAIGNELGVDVAYAGLAFYDVYTGGGEPELYDADLTHPSYAGSYLAAMTLFARITGVDPATVDYNGSLSEDAAALLREAARKAVFETPVIPEDYKTTSEGVVFDPGYTVDTSKTKNLTSFPSSSLISVLRGGTYPNGKSFSGILGTKNAIASLSCSTTGLSDDDKADIADIGYGVSVIGIEKMNASSAGYTTAVENLVNGHWGVSYMACFEFDDKKYNINGEADKNAPYTGLITLNFGSSHRFDAIGFSSGNLYGFPGVAEVYVSDDGVNWKRVPTACWDGVNGTKLVSCGATPADPWNGNEGAVTCLFDMEGVSGQYIRLGVIIGRSDNAANYNTINTRELLVYGEKLDA